MNDARYTKQIKLKGFGRPAQELLQNSKVLIVGAGGLGTPCAQYLNAAGVGQIGLMDADRIEPSNLPRQTLYNEADVGLYKVEVLCNRLQQQNPATAIVIYNAFLTEVNALDIIKGYDLVIDASDNFGTRYLVNDSSVILGKPFIYGALHEFEGQVSVLNFKDGPTYRCLFPEAAEADPMILNCADNGVLGVLPALIGTYQAIEAIKVITGNGQTLSGSLLIIDTLSQSHFKIAVTANAENKKIKALRQHYQTPVCSAAVATVDAETFKQWRLQMQLVVVDVREQEEVASLQMPGSLNIPLAQIEHRKNEIDFSLPVITICQTGQRSMKAALLLINENKLRKVFSLSGGLSALS